MESLKRLKSPSSPFFTRSQSNHEALSDILSSIPEHEGIGAEPGIDPRDKRNFEQYGHILQDCIVEVVDYSVEKVHARKFEKNHDFVLFLRMEPPVLSLPSTAPVRWINVAGVSWDVMAALAIKYDLHSLALEDVLGEQGHNQSKVDYYSHHLFIRILAHRLSRHESDEDAHHYEGPGENVPQLDTKDTQSTSSDLENPANRSPSMIQRAWSYAGLSGSRSARRRRQQLSNHALKGEDKINIRHEPFFIFLMGDETVITIHPQASLTFTNPIMRRLEERNSILRSHEDASILVESLLDLIVDRILEMMDVYQDRINTLENSVLLDPDMEVVRSLHILSGELILHKRTLEPIKTVLFGLRRYDAERTRAAKLAFAKSRAAKGRRREMVARPMPLQSDSSFGMGSDDDRQPHTEMDLTQGEGYMSYTSKIYLADVYDHMTFVLASLDMFSGISENLINYAFNTASYEMNSTMQRLTAATIVFLPLSFITSYFGQNFTSSWTSRSDIFFCMIAVPIMAVYLPLVFFSEIKHLLRHWERKMKIRQVTRPVRQTLGLTRSNFRKLH
ncbi:magnesium transporter [Flagelloscypha sp. PMI_526]|nr:magnesium transporter [Flagelloscypha sp. PMI_526]